ncbi:unnamed protein product, partial [Prorocentrum cordatum]
PFVVKPCGPEILAEPEPAPPPLRVHDASARRHAARERAAAVEGGYAAAGEVHVALAGGPPRGPARGGGPVARAPGAGGRLGGYGEGASGDAPAFQRRTKCQRRRLQRIHMRVVAELITKGESGWASAASSSSSSRQAAPGAVLTMTSGDVACESRSAPSVGRDGGNLAEPTTTGRGAVVCGR